MKEYVIDETSVKTTIEGFKYEDAEYVLNEIHRDEILPLTNVVVTPAKNGDWVVNYDLIQPKFERIRRITGYLVGTMDRWNNAKREEERDRVKHEVS